MAARAPEKVGARSAEKPTVRDESAGTAGSHDEGLEDVAARAPEKVGARSAEKPTVRDESAGTAGSHDEGLRDTVRLQVSHFRQNQQAFVVYLVQMALHHPVGYLALSAHVLAVALWIRPESVENLSLREVML